MVFDSPCGSCVNMRDVMILADKTCFNKECVTQLEHWIDEYQDKLPPLKNFILPVCFHHFSHICTHISRNFRYTEHLSRLWL